jgi:hypothetical protein
VTDNLQQKIGSIQRALHEDADSYMFANFPPGLPANSPMLSGVPAGLGSVLELTDGPRGGNVALFQAARIEHNQFYCDGGEILEGGRSAWLCFAVSMDFPLMIKRATGAVWWFPEMDLEDYLLSDRFEQLAGSVEEFVDQYLTGEGYARLFGNADDPWYSFLRRQGLVS